MFAVNSGDFLFGKALYPVGCKDHSSDVAIIAQIGGINPMPSNPGSFYSQGVLSPLPGKGFRATHNCLLWVYR